MADQCSSFKQIKNQMALNMFYLLVKNTIANNLSLTDSTPMNKHLIELVKYQIKNH